MVTAKPWSPTQFDSFDRLRRLWDERRAVATDAASFAGGVQWKVVSGREYLIHWHYDAEGARRFESKGPRSPETEAWAARFLEGRQACRSRLAALDESLRMAAALGKVAKLGRAPVVVGDVLRALSRSDAANRVSLIGSYSLLAYETAARRTLPSDLLALQDDRPDLDLLVRDERDLDAVARVLADVDPAFHRQGYGAGRFRGPVDVDCFTLADLDRVASSRYERRAEETVSDTIREAPKDGFLFDRSGMIAPVRVLPIDAFATLMGLRAMQDESRSAEERRLDERRFEAARDHLGADVGDLDDFDVGGEVMGLISP